MSKNQKKLTLLGEEILPGQSKTLYLELARLPTATKLKIPVIVCRSKKPGPTVLFSAGIHGDEINGVEIVRQLIVRKLNKPDAGTIICIPVINIFGFVNQSREFPDGRDLNRVFPGSKKGSMAGRFAYYILKEILPVVDFAVDFHAGGAKRFNAAQIRIVPGDAQLLELAQVFAAPFILYSKNISGSFRTAAEKAKVPMLLFEGGMSLDINPQIVHCGVNGVIRLLNFWQMRKDKDVPIATESTILERSGWVRAKASGFCHDRGFLGKFVQKGTVLCEITDPFGKFVQAIKAPHHGYVINANLGSIVYEGDALYHLSIEKSAAVETQFYKNDGQE